MILIGLTGSIGTGKTTVARMFARCGAAVLDSDKVVHALLGPRGKAVKKVAALFPAALKGNAIDRAALGREVFADSRKMKALEAILHPLVWQAQEVFIRKAAQKKKRFVVLDIPLLFETKAQGRFDAVVVTDAPYVIQRERVLARAGMTKEKFARILTMQMPAAEKRRRADFIVPTGQGMEKSLKAVKQILVSLSPKPARKKT